MLHSGCRVEGAGCGFENSFRDVVLIPSVQILDVQIQPPLLDERF